MIATILKFVTRRWQCSLCQRWFIRTGTYDKAYCSYVCGAAAQPGKTASAWGFTSTPGAM